MLTWLASMAFWAFYFSLLFGTGWDWKRDISLCLGQLKKKMKASSTNVVAAASGISVAATLQREENICVCVSIMPMALPIYALMS